jgi:hypothetical protein
MVWHGQKEGTKTEAGEETSYDSFYRDIRVSVGAISE